jgi:hypothetical protein
MFSITDLGTVPGVGVIVQVVVSGIKMGIPKLAGGCTVLVASLTGLLFSLGFTIWYVGSPTPQALFEAVVRGIFGVALALGISWSVRQPSRTNGDAKPP